MPPVMSLGGSVPSKEDLQKERDAALQELERMRQEMNQLKAAKSR